MKKLLFLLLSMLTVGSIQAQSAKKQAPPPGPGPHPNELQLQWPGKNAALPVENPFQVSPVNYAPVPSLNRSPLGSLPVRIERDASGRPIAFMGATETPDRLSLPLADRINAYLYDIMPEGIQDPSKAFTILESHSDEQGNLHVRLQQRYNNVPVYGGELLAHTHQGYFDMLNGRYLPGLSGINTSPLLQSDEAVLAVKTDLGPEKIKETWTPLELDIVGGTPFKSELVIYSVDADPRNARLVWHIEAHPNLMKRYVYFVDALTGDILNHYDYTCQIDGGRLQQFPGPVPPPDGAVTATGLDLLNVNRTFGAWQNGNTIYMEDASKPMFNNSASTMPTDPVGAIITLDALNTSPEISSSFNYSLLTSGTTTFNNKKAVSAHWNSIKSYDYYKNTFNRNSIDGVGGNIYAFINVSESDGSSMENAFWNGDAMWYGNGGTFFKELARGLDVGGHEMTHGVIEKTANLLYQNESGALNESFADVFGAMIDRDDWKIGEDVMQSGVSPNGCLRDMQNPHNGDSQGGNWWQPQHVSEKYNGTQDNGGVHINSGIPNRAYYLFASNAAVGKDKAEQVYYKALRDYLVKSSQFVDLRIAVLQASNDLYGSTVANAAAAAFDQVGITGSAPGGNYLGQLSVNPGSDFILCATNDLQNIDIINSSGAVLKTLYNQGIKSRPSITDNGSQVVFVNADGDIIGADITYGAQINVQLTVLSTQPVWRNAAISKDGRFVAALYKDEEPYIYVFDLFTNESEAFELYNPTYSTGQITGDVRYADVLEFDYSGEYLMYDAFNELANNSGQDISYWDIGFLQFWENNNFTPGNNAFISKLFSGLPENTSIGDPSFAKNSPYIIAFDLIDGQNNSYDILGANVETGDYSTIVSNNGVLGWPNYNRLDNTLIFESQFLFSYNLYKVGLNSNKIQAQGSISTLKSDRNWGVWYANGNRSLSVATELPAGKQPLEIAPNPTSDAFVLRLDSKQAGSAQLSITDRIGHTVLEQHLELAPGLNTLDVSLSGMPAGQYMVQIQTADCMARTMLVKI